MIRNGLFAALVFSAAAFAQAAQTKIEKAPVIDATHKLACPAGTAQVGGAKSGMSMLGCFKIGAGGQRVFHGPMITFHTNGTVEGVGQQDEGFQAGKWTFFDDKGVKTSEIEFKRSAYHGRKVVFFATGMMKSEEFWVDGKRQGAQKSWDDKGTLSVVQFLDDRPVK